MHKLKGCRNCGSKNYVKNGKQKKTGLQKFKCKDCGKYFQIDRQKYDLEFKLLAIKQYIRGGSSIRAIADILGVHNSLISYWIKNYHDLVKKLVSEMPEDIDSVRAVEMDEMFLYIKKKDLENGIFYGFALTNGEAELLILK